MDKFLVFIDAADDAADIIIIDELSMMNIRQLNYIKQNKDKIGLCILLGDKNQLNPVKSNELDIEL